MKQVFLLISIGLYGCSESIIAPTETDYSYFPVGIGLFYEYQVSETTYSLLGEESSEYEIREEFFDYFLSEKDTTYLIKRYSRPDSTHSWQADSVYSLRRTKGQLIVTENNIPYIRLLFPSSIGAEWNGNAFNSLPLHNFKIVEASEFLSPLDLPSLIKVEISDIPKTLVKQDQRYHLYSKGVGLVEKNYIRVNFATSGPNLGAIESGRILKQYLKKYGQD